MTPIKSVFIAAVAAVVFTLAAVPGSLAQTASFNFDDGNGPADAGSYPAGASFTFSVNLSFAPGGNVTDLLGLSYWFEQRGGLAPFYLSITDRDVTGSQFTDLQNPHLTYPQNIAPSNPSDLGALTGDFTAVGAGNYFIANVSVSISPSAALGTYIIENTTTGGKSSVISDDRGDTFAIPQTTYTITVVPFKITSIAPENNGNILLQCQGVPNSVNRIEASPDLSANSFETIGSVTPDMSGAFSFEDTSPGTQRFYRLAFP